MLQFQLIYASCFVVMVFVDTLKKDQYTIFFSTLKKSMMLKYSMSFFFFALDIGKILL